MFRSIFELPTQCSKLKLILVLLLDFHYSDTWADPSNQEIPLAWLTQINNTGPLGDLLYNYTYDTLNDLANSNLLPEIVQIGNEISVSYV